MKILIADDDADLRALISFTLQQNGLEVCSAADGRAALDVFEFEAPNILVLDLDMPHLDGFEVCRLVRQRSNVPVLVLTVSRQEDDLVAAFDFGADGYVLKPFSPRVLLARIRALARRTESATDRMIQSAGIRLDLEQHTLQIAQAEAIRVTPQELKALQLLITNAGRTVSIDRLQNHIWGRLSTPIEF